MEDLDWDNVQVFHMEPDGSVSVFRRSDDDDENGNGIEGNPTHGHVLDINMIQVDEGSNVVLRTVEDFSNVGVEVIRILEHGEGEYEFAQNQTTAPSAATSSEAVSAVAVEESVQLEGTVETVVSRKQGGSSDSSAEENIPVVDSKLGVVASESQETQKDSSSGELQSTETSMSIQQSVTKGETVTEPMDVDEEIKSTESPKANEVEELEEEIKEKLQEPISEKDPLVMDDDSEQPPPPPQPHTSQNKAEENVLKPIIEGATTAPTKLPDTSQTGKCKENDSTSEVDLRKVKEEVTPQQVSPASKKQAKSKMLPPPPPAASAVVVDPGTGRTVALVNSPSSKSRILSKDHQRPPLQPSPQEIRIPIPIPQMELSEDISEYELLNDVRDLHSEEILVSSDEEDEAYKIQMKNARTLLRVKQPVDNSAATHRPRFVSRRLLHKKHPKCAGLSFKDIMHQTILEDKILPDFNEQVLPQNIVYLLRKAGHEIHKYPDGSHMIFSKHKNIKMYHSSFSARFEPILADAEMENYVQEYRKTLQVQMWKKRLFGTKEVDPSSVIPASIGSTGSSSIGSETDPECLATDEEESESELMQGSVAAWIIPDAIVSRTPSPEPDFDEPQFIATTQVGSHTIVEGPPTKKRKQKHHEPKPHTDGKIYPKPAFSYSCLIAMALKNSKTGSLPVSEIYKFMCDHFPYFKSAPSGWKNSVRHNLSLNKCFEKIEKPGNNGARKGCLWALNPAKIHKMDEEVQKWSRKDPLAIRRAMSDPENLELIERGELKRDYSGAGGSDDDEDEDFSEPATPLTPAQLQARRSRTNSSDSTLEGATAVVTPVVTTVSQVHAALQRSIDPKNQIQVKREDAVELGTIANLQGNYVCHTPTGNGTYTLSFANLGSSSPLTPIIIRRTPTVK